MAYADQKKGLEARVDPSATEFQYIDEKAESQNSRFENPGSGPSENKARLKVPAVLKNSKMPSFRHFLITFTVFVILTITYTSAAAIQSRNGHGTTIDEIRFQELLDTVSDASLHKVLEQYISSKYQPGVYEKDRTAMQAVHQEDAAVATSLVELAKRQNNASMTIETDTVRVPTTSAVTVQPETSLSEPTATSAEPTTNPETNSPSATPETSDSAVSSSPLPTITTSPVPTSDESSTSILHSSAPTNTHDTSQTTATPGTTPSTSAPSATSVPDSSSHQSSSFAASETSTTSKNIPNTSTAGASTSHDASSTDADKAPSSTTRRIVYTTLHPDGSLSTVTSYTVVPASQGPTNAGASPTETPGLQNAAVRCDGAGIMGYALIAIAGMAVAF